MLPALTNNRMVMHKTELLRFSLYWEWFVRKAAQ
jgi:hypothetical protein